MSKYYAVRAGRIIGIYTKWSECEDQVKGFSGAIYKSFPTREQAREFMNSKDKPASMIKQRVVENSSDKQRAQENSLADRRVIENSSDKQRARENSLDIYTDGSDNNGLRLGAYCEYNGPRYLSKKIDRALLKTWGINNTHCSNPTAEFIAFGEVLRILNKNEDEAAQFDLITFHIDYVGVKNWMSGDWNTKEEHIKSIKERCILLIGKLNIEIKWVRGHSGVYGNEMADKMASSLEEMDTFSGMFV
jgi:ribonuclease H-related protein